MGTFCTPLTCGYVSQGPAVWGYSCSSRTGTSRPAGPGLPIGPRSGRGRSVPRFGGHPERVTSRRRRAMAAASLTVALAGCGGGAALAQRPAPVSTVVPGPHGAVEHVIPRDSAFGAHGDYTIYLPPGYGQDPRRRYPVVYLLHGGSDNDRFFVELGVGEAMDAA